MANKEDADPCWDGPATLFLLFMSCHEKERSVQETCDRIEEEANCDFYSLPPLAKQACVRDGLLD